MNDAGRRERFLRNFWASIDRTGDCWLWTKSRRPNGYGQTTRDRRNVTVHRVSWELANGPIPAGLYVCHTCDVRHCVNPAHLFLGTSLDNKLDSVTKGRHATHNKPFLDVDADAVRQRVANGETQQAVADDLGISQTSVWAIVRRKGHWGIRG
jgi:hypothetical protein